MEQVGVELGELGGAFLEHVAVDDFVDAADRELDRQWGRLDTLRGFG